MVNGVSSAQRGELKLRRAEERIMVQYIARAGSFKRLLGGRARRPYIIMLFVSVVSYWRRSSTLASGVAIRS